MADSRTIFKHSRTVTAVPGTRAVGRARRARGLTIVELLMSSAILSTLMALLLPAVQASREASRNVSCQNHLRQIGVALTDHHDRRGALPPGWSVDASGESALGWLPFVLAELEETGLSRELDVTQPLTPISPRLSTTPAVLLCPADVAEPSFDLFVEIGDHETHAQESQQTLVILPAASYLGVFGTTDPDHLSGTSGDGTFIEDRSCRFAEITRGLSHVMLVGERTARKLPSTWLGVVLKGEDSAGRLTGYCDLGPNRPDADECEFDSRHPGHVNFLWGDGHVDAVADHVDRQLYQQLARRR
jgi:prepilin-type processing-associated H-X9-DG protein